MSDRTLAVLQLRLLVIARSLGRTHRGARVFARRLRQRIHDRTSIDLGAVRSIGLSRPLLLPSAYQYVADSVALRSESISGEPLFASVKSGALGLGTPWYAG